jgi:hypothetical protein
MFMLMLAIHFLGFSKNICWKCQNYIDGGRIWQQEFDAIVGN